MDERERDLLEGCRVSWPFFDILVQRVTMEPKIIPPVVNGLFLKIRTGAQSCGFGGIIGVEFHLLFHRQIEELSCYLQHLLHRLHWDTMVYHLHFTHTNIYINKQSLCGYINLQ